MTVHPGAALVLLFSFQCSTGPLIADDGDWDVRWEEGFRVESVDAGFKLKLGGRLQADFAFVASQSDGLRDRFGTFEDFSELRRARLFMQGTVYEKVEFKVEYDFATGEAEAKDVYLGFVDTPAGNIRIGHSKEPLSLETLTSSNFQAFIERSLPVIFAPGRNLGIVLHDSTDRFTWGAGVFRESDAFATSAGEDQRNLTGRIVWRPLYENDGSRIIHVAVGATNKDTAGVNSELRARPEVNIGNRLADTGTFAVDGQDVLALEAAGVLGPFWFAGEYLKATLDTPASGRLDFDGYYVQVGVFLTGESRGYKTSSGTFDRTRPRRNFDGGGGRGAWEVALRYSSTDLSDADISGGVLDGTSVALNWYPNPITRLMLNWVQPRLQSSGDADFVVVRAQIDF